MWICLSYMFPACIATQGIECFRSWSKVTTRLRTGLGSGTSCRCLGIGPWSLVNDSSFFHWHQQGKTPDLHLSSLTYFLQDLKHQHHEITQLGERTSQLASSQETVVREATHNVQHHLSGKLDSIATEIVTGHKHSMSAISSLEKTIKHDVPALSTAVKEVKTAVSCVDENLGRHETSSHGRHTELKKVGCLHSYLHR